MISGRGGPEVLELGDLFEKQSPQQIHIGTVGWDGIDEWYEKGTAENDGHTLVRVQLFRGRDITKPLTRPEIGQGHKLLCMISSGLFRIPPKGTRCYVALPAGYESIPGAGVIFATVEKSPIIQFDDDRVNMNFGDDKHIVIRGKSVSISDSANRFIGVGTPRAGGDPGLFMQDTDGGGLIIQNSLTALVSAKDGTVQSTITLSPTYVRVLQKDGSFLKLEGGNAYTFGTANYVTGAAVYLGALPSVATPALWGVTGPAGVPSPSVYISSV